MSKELTSEQELNNGLYVLELEERLEMVQAAESADAAGPVISCCFDSAAAEVA